MLSAISIMKPTGSIPSLSLMKLAKEVFSILKKTAEAVSFKNTLIHSTWYFSILFFTLRNSG